MSNKGKKYFTEKRVIEIAKQERLDEIPEDDQVMSAFSALGEMNIPYNKSHLFLKQFGYVYEVRYRAIRDQGRFS